MRGLKYEEMPLEQAVLEALHSLTAGTRGASISSIALLVRTDQNRVRSIVNEFQARGIVGWKEGTEGRHWYLIAGRE